MEHHRNFSNAMGEIWYDRYRARWWQVGRQVHKTDMLLSIYTFLGDWVSVYFKNLVRKRSL